MIELTPTEARFVLAALELVVPRKAGQQAFELLEAKTIAAEEEEREELARSLSDRFLEGWQRGTARARASTSPAPKWEYLARAVKAIDRSVGHDPRSVANTDRLAAYLRDTLDSLGLSITDPDSLYVLLVGAGLMVEMASNGRAKDPTLTSAETVKAIAGVAQAMTAALIPYLPDEAKR